MMVHLAVRWLWFYAGAITQCQVVWPRKGLQRACHGPAWSITRRSFQLLQPAVYNENSPYAGRSGYILHIQALLILSIVSDKSVVF